MKDTSRNIDRQKVYIGVLLLCVGAVLMLVGQEVASPAFKMVWVALFGVGVFFYLWGRFFSRGSA
jgi:energy-converting hydrogenase Eha subunit E